MVWEKPKQLRNGPGATTQKSFGRSPEKAQEWSGRRLRINPKRLSLKRLETVGEKQAKKWFEKGSEGGLSPETVLEGGPRLHQQVLGGGPGCTSNGPWGGGRLRQQRSLGGARLHQQKVLGLGSLPLTLKGSTALTASVGLTLPWSVQQPQLYLGCTFSALRSLAKLGRLRALKCW